MKKIGERPLVSIIIPTYNRSDYVLKAINSCLTQTYKNIEIIIIDDNSEDHTSKKISQVKDKRVKYFKNSNNKGGPYSRNRGFDLSSGEYINFLDDDDMLLPDKITLQIEKFKTSTVSRLGVVTCDVRYRRSDINSIRKNRKKGRIFKDLLKSYCVYGTETMLIKRDYFSYFDINLKSNQEYDLAIRLSKKSNFDYVPKLLTEKFESIDQISFNFDKKIAGTKFLYKKYLDDFKKEKVYLYNFFRFKYLCFKYYVGKYLGKRVYNWLK